MTSSPPKYQAPKLELDLSLYRLDDDEKAFFQQLTGIQDEDKLREHIIGVQTKAFKIFNYPCIRNYGFIKLKIARLPACDQVQKLLKERENPILLDLGCCFGNDARKAVVDGWPVENVIATDLEKGFWDCGHELFKSTPETFPAGFVAGDIFDPTILAPRGPFVDKEDIDAVNSKPLPPLRELTSLTPLQGKVSVIHASSFFHLFQEEKQKQVAYLMSSMLSPEPGSVILGVHVGMPHKGLRNKGGHEYQMFCHSPESWEEMWQEVFSNGDAKGQEKIKVEAKLVQLVGDNGWTAVMNDGAQWRLYWSVTRI